MKQLLMLCIFCFSVVCANAQDDMKRLDFDSRHQIGVLASATNGTGLSYRFTQETQGVQIVIAPVGAFFADDIEARITAAFNYNYYIRQARSLDFSFFAGGRIAYETFFDEAETDFRLGMGIQLDLHLGDELNMETLLGYGIYNLGDSPSSNLTVGLGFTYNIYL